MGMGRTAGPATAPSTETRVQLRGLTKRFGGLVANDAVDFDVRVGEVHALLGENGAGKSTLMNVLYGLYQPDEGEILIEGKPCRFESPRGAIGAGIGMVHQHFMLVPALTVLENILIGIRSRREPLLDFKTLRREIGDTLRAYKINLDLDARVSELSVGVQQRVEIVKVLYRGARTLILDEPTAVLTPQEADEFFAVLGELRSLGHSIVFITHKLREVEAVSDRVTVLRAGRVVGTGAIRDFTSRQLAERMVGRELVATRSLGPAQGGKPVLAVEGLTCSDERGTQRVKDVSLLVKRGEIVGVAGVDGNGQTELAKAIAGLRGASAGRVWIDGKDCTQASPKERFRLGLGHIPQDRQRMGLVTMFSISENMILQTHDVRPFARLGTLDSETIAEHASRLISRFSIRTSSADAPVNTLSGGNQQKVILAREFSRDPELMLAVQPTRGLDIGATEFVHEQLIAARDSGKGVLLISTELDEIMSLSDRILVMFDGRIVGELDGGRAAREEVGMLMAGRVRPAERERSAEP